MVHVIAAGKGKAEVYYGFNSHAEAIRAIKTIMKHEKVGAWYIGNMPEGAAMALIMKGGK